MMEDLAVEEARVHSAQCDRSIAIERETEVDVQVGRSVDVENGGRSGDGDVDSWWTSHLDRKKPNLRKQRRQST
jgi:hypothetical protein